MLINQNKEPLNEKYIMIIGSSKKIEAEVQPWMVGACKIFTLFIFNILFVYLNINICNSE